MLPKISNGDIVICDKNMICENGNIVHYTTIDGESGIKKYTRDETSGMITLYPLNTDNYTPIVIQRDDLRCVRCFRIMSEI